MSQNGGRLLYALLGGAGASVVANLEGASSYLMGGISQLLSLRDTSAAHSQVLTLDGVDYLRHGDRLIPLSKPESSSDFLFKELIPSTSLLVVASGGLFFVLYLKGSKQWDEWAYVSKGTFVNAMHGVKLGVSEVKTKVQAVWARMGVLETKIDQTGDELEITDWFVQRRTSRSGGSSGAYG